MTTTPEPVAGTVVVTLTIAVPDAVALIAAGRRSVTRDLVTYWPPGSRAGDHQVTPDAVEAIQSPDQAVVDLVVEAIARCYQPANVGPAYLDDLEPVLGDMDVLNREWIPATPGELSTCVECGEEIQLVGASWVHTDRYDGTRTLDDAAFCQDDDGSSFAANMAAPTPPPSTVRFDR